MKIILKFMLRFLILGPMFGSLLGIVTAFLCLTLHSGYALSFAMHEGILMGLTTGVILAPIPCWLGMKQGFSVTAMFLVLPSSTLALIPALTGFAPGVWMSGILGYLLGTVVLFVRFMAEREEAQRKSKIHKDPKPLEC